MFLSSVIVLSVLLFTAILLLGVRIFFEKNGKFPNTHIGGDKNMRKKGIGCATSQDRAAQNESRNKIDVRNLY